MDKLIKKYEEIRLKLDGYRLALNTMHFDNATIAPKKSLEEKAQLSSIISMAYFEILNSSEYIDVVNNLYDLRNELTNDYKREIELVKKDLDKITKIPSELYQELTILTSNAYPIWINAKANNDFNSFAPYLDKLIKLNKKIASLTNSSKHPYEVLLDEYEEGITIEYLDKFFNALKERIIPLVNEIKNSKVIIDDEFTKATVSHSKQLKFSKLLLSKIGFDFSRGAIAETEHPFCSTISNNDIRITTHIYEKMFFSNIFATIHEGGHALYEQNLSDSLKGSVLKQATSYAVHESQSRFYENMVGRSFEFIEKLYPKIKSLLPSKYEYISELDMFKAANKVEPSFIRIEADELTYSLHIIIRYEIEKLMFSSDIDVYELPNIWNKLYKEYLGVEVESDSLGILQDSHWAGGAFGYFPSYALGNAMAAQLANAMDFDLKDVLTRDKISVINKWFKDNVYIYGRRVSPSELIKIVTKEELNPKYYCDYLEAKFKDLYNLNEKNNN